MTDLDVIVPGNCIQKQIGNPLKIGATGKIELPEIPTGPPSKKSRFDFKSSSQPAARRQLNLGSSTPNKNKLPTTTIYPEEENDFPNNTYNDMLSSEDEEFTTPQFHFPDNRSVYLHF